jgi:hypothetical protein
MEDDEENLSLRDKFAIQIFAALLNSAGIGIASAILENKSFNVKTAEFPASERLIYSSYALADIMRKIRIKAFD